VCRLTPTVGSNPTLSATYLLYGPDRSFESVVSSSTFCASSHITAVHTNVLTTAREDCILSQSRRAMRFEWNEQENRQNLHRHDVRFETAVLVFDDPYAITQRDVTFEDEGVG